ncbi:MAG: single-stranded DNA-binding protein [Clostridia bacterium]|nr:single-stranded DNA-binding protein [Clostridia bacterium]
MNKLTIIGNLTRDPELRTTSTGLNVCSFTVAVNRRRSANSNQPEADFFRVSAWRQLGENCQRYLAKGRKVCVIGPVSVSTYTANDGTTRASLEVTADDVEFLSSRNEDAGFTPAAPSQPAAAAPAMNGFEEVDDEDLPF